jgi:hypothetical protein
MRPKVPKKAWRIRAASFHRQGGFDAVTDRSIYSTHHQEVVQAGMVAKDPSDDQLPGNGQTPDTLR